MTSGLCTGCAGCVIACPHDVLGYDDTNGVYKPFHLEDRRRSRRLQPRRQGLHQLHPGLPAVPGLGARDRHLPLRPGAPSPRRWTAFSKDIVLARATDPEVLEKGQDGGLVSAILLWCLEHGYIDAALVSYLEGDGTTWKAIPGVARTREEILAAAGIPLHLLGQHHGLRARRSPAAPRSSPWSA